MARWKSGVLIALGLAVLAGGLRFYRLGDWPFRGDELATLQEWTAWVHGAPLDPGSQTYRLPRLLPLSYGFYSLGYELFGQDEFASRVCPALLGTLYVLLAFFMLGSSSTMFPWQRDLVADRLASSDIPTILGGDFNVSQHASLVEQFAEFGYATVQYKVHTWHRRPFVLDHIFYNSGLRCTGHSVAHTLASDHLPVVADFDFGF